MSRFFSRLSYDWYVFKVRHANAVGLAVIYLAFQLFLVVLKLIWGFSWFSAFALTWLVLGVLAMGLIVVGFLALVSWLMDILNW